MIRYSPFAALVWLLSAPLAPAQQVDTTAANRVVLVRLANGAADSFVRAGSGDWGIEISGGTAPNMTQPKPAQIEVYRDQTNAQQCRTRNPGHRILKQSL